jgi:hypothetical protein
MFKKVLTALLLLILTHLSNAQTIDSTNLQSDKLLETHIDSNELLTAKSVEIKDSSLIKAKDSLILQNRDSVIILSKNAAIAQQMDSIWLKTGDTLVGFINLDKEKNAFLFTNDSLKQVELKAIEIVRFVSFPKNYEDERLDIFSVFNAFYFLETQPNAPIRVFTNRTYKTVLNDGPKHFIAKINYCLFKNDVPYFLNTGRSKEILLFLMNDCKKIMEGFKTRKYTLDNFIEAVTQYNRCNE